LKVLACSTGATSMAAARTAGKKTSFELIVGLRSQKENADYATATPAFGTGEC
jgi:hypothetical protein